MWRKRFTLKYLRQHYLVIRMYLQWVRPYMKHLKRLTSDSSRMDSPDIVSAFESSMIEVELLARMMPENNKKFYSIGLINMKFRTHPQMSYVQEGSYQRGPLHVGEVRLQYRTYAWSEEDIKRYLSMREREDFELLLGIDTSLREAMEDIDSDLRQYLEEAGEQFEKKEEPKSDYHPQGLLSPLSSVVGAFTDIFTAFKSSPHKKEGKGHSFFKSGGKSGKQAIAENDEKERAYLAARFLIWLSYKNYKAAHRMLTW